MTTGTIRVSLHDVAPRLARARDVERWNIWCAGDDGFVGIKDGERWAETLSADHSTGRCSCGGTVDHYRITQRFLVGQNRGRVGLIESWKCRRLQSDRCEWRSRHR